MVRDVILLHYTTSLLLGAMTRPQVALVIGILAISIFPVLIKLELAPGVISAFYRMAFSAILLIPYVLLTKRFKLPKRKYLLLSILCGLIFGMDVAVWNISIQESTATQATLLTNLSPVWVGLGMFLFFPNKPKKNFWFGTIIALMGMIVLIGTDFILSLSFDRAFIFAILSGILYAHYMLISKNILSKVDVLSFMSITIFSASVFLGFVSYFLQQPFSGFGNMGWTVLIIQAIVCQLLAWLLLSYATQQMRATRVSISLLAQGFISALLAWIFLKEQITSQMIIGGIILLIGIRVTFIEKSFSSIRVRKRNQRLKLN